MQLSSPLFVIVAMVPIVAALLLGAQLKLEYLRDVVSSPLPLAVGLAGQFLFLPTLAVLLCLVVPGSQDLRWGWFLLAAVPGGAISNMVTFLGRGRLSLSVVLTACSTLAGMVTIPLWLSVGTTWLGGEAGPPLPITSMVLGSFVLLVIPLVLGFLIGITQPSLVERLRRPTRWVMLGLLLAAAISYTAQRWDSISADFDSMLFAGAAAFHITAVLSAWALSRAVGLDRRDSFTVGIEVGVQNAVVALLVVELLNRPALIPFVGYYMLMMVALLIVWIPMLGERAASNPDSQGIAT